MKYYISLDFGTSKIKASIMPINGHPAIEQITRIDIDSMFYTNVNGNLSRTRNTLEEPAQYAGIVGEAVKDIDPVNCGILRTSSIVERREFGMGVFFTLGKLLEQVEAFPKDIVIEKLAIGFPASHVAAIEKAREILIGTHPIRISGGKTYDVTIQDVISESQGFYVALDQITQFVRTENGKFHLSFDRAESLIPTGQLFVMVHGSNTIELVLITSTLHEAACENIKFGTYNHFSRLREIAHTFTGADLTNYELMEIFKTGKLTFRRQDYDFNAEIQGIVENAYRTLAGQAFETFLDTNMARPVLCLCAGGGSIRSHAVLRELYADRFPVELAVDDNDEVEPIKSVLRGMEKYLVIKHYKK